MGNNRLHALMLVHVHNSILDSINLADVVKINLMIEKTAAKKYSDIFLGTIHNVYQIKLTRSTLHIFIFPIKCIKRGAERSIIH